MGDRGTPYTFRHMNGYSSHTYMWIHAKGKKFWAKYHFKTDQGIKSFTDEEAADYRFNPFDLTKVWPHADYPLIKVGRMVLDRNPDDHFAQIEQSAFEPANMVPGIGPSPDKMLQGQLFSYPDTHRHRIGPNYLQLPVNQPKSGVHTYNKDGPMRYQNYGDPVYAPNSYGGAQADPELYKHETYEVTGEILRAASRKYSQDDDFGQAGTMVREVLDEPARERLASNIIGHASAGVEADVQQRVVEYWRNATATSVPVSPRG